MQACTKWFAATGSLILLISVAAMTAILAAPGFSFKENEVYTEEFDLAPAQGDAMVNAVSWSPNGKWLATACFDGTIRIWEWPSHSLFRSFPNGRWAVNSISWSPNSSWLASGLGNGIKIWDVEKDDLITFITYGARIEYVVFSPDGLRLACASQDTPAKNGTCVWNTTDWSLEVQMPRNITTPGYMAWLNNGARLMTWSPGTTKIQIWDAADGELIRTFLYYYSPFSLSPDGKWLAYRDFGLLNLETGISSTLVWPRPFQRDVFAECYTWSPDGTRLAVGTDCGIAVLDMSSPDKPFNRTFYTISRQPAYYTDIAWSPDGRWIAVGNIAGPVQLFARDSDGDGIPDHREQFPLLNDRPVFILVLIAAAATTWMVAFVVQTQEMKNATHPPKSG